MRYFNKKNSDLSFAANAAKDDHPMTGGTMSEEDAPQSIEAEKIMEKFDRESNTRLFAGIPAFIVKALLIMFSLYVMYQSLFSRFDVRVRRAIFVSIVIFLAFLLYPYKKGIGKKRANYVPWYDCILGLAGSACYLYYVFNFERIINTAGRITLWRNSAGTLQPDIVVGVLGILILLEACRRVSGMPIVCVASVFIIYAFSTGMSLKKFIYSLFYTTEGVLGTPINACSSYIMLFLIFGAFLERTKISEFFINLAKSIAGSASGGPAKVAVISSALCGTVSGSSVANTVTTGSVTIPMMKETGYKPEFAGAVEAAASTGGQIMPPIMGTAAFLMAEIVGIPYGRIVGSAILPALLYFTGIFLMVHFEARRLNLKGLPKDELPKFGKLFLSKGYLLLPLILLVILVTSGFTMAYSAIYASLSAILISLISKETRITPKGFFEALETGAKNAVSISMACGVAGIIAGVITVTGLGNVLIKIVLQLAGRATILALMTTMIACIVLGMGVPTTANYIIMATTCAPILMRLGVDIFPANMFVFYFGIVADITPPVALAAYAGSAIAGSSPIKTGVNASKLAIAAFIVPYVFVYNPALLLIGTNVFQILQIFITAILGMFGISMGVSGYFKREIPLPVRFMGIATGICMIMPDTLTDILGFLALATIVAFLMLQDKRAAQK